MSKKKQRTVGFAFTGSFCTYEKIKEVVRQLVKEDNRVIPIFSQTAQTVNCRFGDARDFIIEIQEITGERGIFSIQEAEPIGPKGLLDILVMAAKAHMRNDKPVVLSPAANDALGASLKNIGFLMNTKNFYFVPFGQDDCEKKPKSMIAHTELIPDTIEAALCGRQLQPVIRSPF